MRLFRFLPLLCLLLAAAHAQTAEWLTGDSGDPSDLQLVFDECEPDGDPRLPVIADATLSFIGSSQQTSIVNFKMTRSVVLNYRLRARSAGQVTIPAFTVKTNKGDLRVAAFTTGAVKQGPEVNVQARLLPGTTTVWAGEIFPLNYTLDVARRSFSQLASKIDWNPVPLTVEDWANFESAEYNASGETRLSITSKTRAYATAPGRITLNATTQLANLAVGTVGFGLFQQQRIEQISVTSNQPAITVRPLPTAPTGFSGGVGQFRLASKVVPTTSAVGEPITWTLELSGSGNWPEIAGLPAREVSKDFQAIQPQAKRTPAEGKLFDVTLAEDVVLVPTKPGTYTLAPVTFTYFDPKAGEYKTTTTPRTTITVTTPNAPKFNVTPPPEEPVTTTTTTKAPQPPAPPTAPAAIPRDPLAGSDPVAKPFSRLRTLALAAATPFAVLALFWLALATRRARQTDPARPRREARQRLAATLAALRAAQTSSSQSSSLDSQPQQQLLLRWQHDTAALWPLRHAAPPATALNDPAWQRLWAESDRALYGTDATLPADWLTRAEAALAAKPVSAFAPWRALLPRNLFPLSVLFVLCVLSLPSTHAADPTADYRKGDFAAAEKTWRAAVTQNPTDWIARHNLALALAQQDRWPEAAAHATAAYVQHPGSEAGRWNLALTCEKAGYTPTVLAPFLTPGPRHLVARTASPAAWDRWLLTAATLAALALGWLIFSAYHTRPGWTNLLAGGALVAAFALGGVALSSRTAYGLAASPEAVVVWRSTTLRSIPTEAETTQKTTTLAAGSVGQVNRTFLGWTHLTLANGQTGWLRQDDIIPLWR